MSKCLECGAENTEQMFSCRQCGKPLRAAKDTPGKKWFYISEGIQRGPISESVLITLFKSGELIHDTLVWTQNLHQWTKARDIAGLGSSGRMRTVVRRILNIVFVFAASATFCAVYFIGFALWIAQRNSYSFGRAAAELLVLIYAVSLLLFPVIPILVLIGVVYGLLYIFKK